MVLFGHGRGSAYANERFAEVFVPDQLDRPEVRRLLRNPGAGWCALTLRRVDGDHRAARAQAVAVDQGVLVVIDDASGQVLPEAYTHLQRRIVELESLSATDSLTGTWNRAQLERTIHTEMSRAARSGQPVSLILLDIDHFKDVNDTHGHLAGDAVLTEFAGRIRGRMRETDSLFRWGGEEFVVLAVAVGYRGGAVLAESLRQTIAAEPFALAGPITASLGVSEYMIGESAESWLDRTDRALYAAKAGGRNRVHVDRKGTSDLDPDRSGIGLLHLNWREAYECGEPTIDNDHRELFRRGNALITATIKRDEWPALWPAALDALMVHLVQHFEAEEAVLARHNYAGLANHQREHAALLQRARELEGVVNQEDGALGILVNFIVRDVIARHFFKVDSSFYPLFKMADSVPHVG
jgi:diguanylate cyclase (GGDEF)-like protein/hemerythrin-like metal-binding protein